MRLHDDIPVESRPKNVLGGPLKPCCFSPKTGFFRDGFCNTSEEDVGSHTVCVIVTDEFLEFSKSRGNDLSTPNEAWGFPGLTDGDKWCMCALRWVEAERAGVAPPVVLDACHERCLGVISLETLQSHAAVK